MERGRKRSRMSTGRASPERRPRTAEPSPPPDQPSSSDAGVKEAVAAVQRHHDDSSPDQPLRRSARLRMKTPPPTYVDARARSPRRKSDASQGTSRAMDGFAGNNMQTPANHVANMIEPTIGVALGALGGGPPPPMQPVLEDPAQLQDPQHLLQQPQQLMHNPVGLPPNLGFPSAPSFGQLPTFAPPTYNPHFNGFLTSHAGFPPPFYASMGFPPPFMQMQDFPMDWRMQPPLQSVSGANMFAPPLYQQPLPFGNQLAAMPSSSAAPAATSSSAQFPLSTSSNAPTPPIVPPAYSRTQRITQTARSTIQSLRSDNSRQPDQQLLENLQSTDLWRRREAVQTISRLILISDEGANLNISFREIVSAVKDLLLHDDFNTKADGVTCLQHLVDVFSRSHGIAADAIPLLITLMTDVREEFGVDVHENALKPLLTLSRRYGRNILQAGGLSGVLRHLYFFNSHAQRSAFEVVANAATYVSVHEWEQVRQVLKDLVDNMTNADSRMADAACAALSRIVSNMQMEPHYLAEILDDKFGLASKIAQVLRDNVNTKFAATTEFLRAVRILMSSSTAFGEKLHLEGLTKTISILLSPMSSKRTVSSFIDIRELIHMCGELAPPLPDTSIFAIDRLIVNKGTSEDHSRDLLRSTWPGSSLECSNADEICAMLVPPLVCIAASLTDSVVQYEILRVLVRLLLPCRHTEIFSTLKDNEYSNPTMLAAVLRDALDWNNPKTYLKVVAIQLIRTMLAKDSQKCTSKAMLHFEIWTMIDHLGSRISASFKVGPLTRNRSKVLAEAASTSTRKRTSPARETSDGIAGDSGIDGPQSKREREGSQAPRAPRRGHLHSLLSFRNSHSESSASSSQISKPKKICDQTVRELTEKESSEVQNWIVNECIHALKQRDDSSYRNLSHITLKCMLDSYNINERQPFYSHLLDFASSALASKPNKELAQDLLTGSVYGWILERVRAVGADELRCIVGAVLSMAPLERRAKMRSLARLLSEGVDLCDFLPVSIFDLSPQSSPNLFHGSHAVRYFRNHVVTISVRPLECNDPADRTGHNTFKVDPLVTMRYIYTVVRNRVPMRQPSSSDEESSNDGHVRNPFQLPEIELHSTQGQGVIDENRVLLEVLLSETAGGMDAVLSSATLHLFQYRICNTEPDCKRAGNTAMSIESRLREELEAVPGEYCTLAPSTSAILASDIIGSQEVARCLMATVEGVEENRSLVADPDNRSIQLCDRLTEPDLPRTLCVLSVFYYVNQYWPAFCESTEWPERPYPLANKSDFVCKKLDAKMNRQLGDFMTVANQGLPGWVDGLANNAPFALSFETRRSYFHLTAFGRERALSSWLQQRDVSTEDSQYTRVKKTTVEVQRDNFLHYAYTALQDTPRGHTLEVKFRGEAGTGHGPTQEFYSILSRELKRVHLQLWYPSKTEIDPETKAKLVSAEHGLFPLPCPKAQRLDNLKFYELLGRAMGQSLQDGKRLDIVLSPIVMKYLIGRAAMIGPADLATVDPVLYNSMRDIADASAEELDAICADFCVPNIDIDIAHDQVERAVTVENRANYIERFRAAMLLTVREPLEAIAQGLDSVFPREKLCCFLPDEFEALFCGAGGADADSWTAERIIDALKFDLGYCRESATVKNLVKMLTEFHPAKRQRFLQFVTGSPRLPHGGFASLSPPLTVVCKSTSCGCPDSEFPSAVTCKNYVKLPNYSSYEVMVRQFEVALANALHFDYN